MSESQIHPTAIIEEGARVGAGCIIHAHAFVGRDCTLAQGVVVHPFAVLGGPPQDLRFDPATHTEVHIGARTVIREHVTVNRATKPNEATRVGADCYLMTACHVAHDCVLGNRVIMANGVLLGGHIEIQDYAFLGGNAVVHQFTRLGESVMIGGGCRIPGDVAPFCITTDKVHGLNMVGLRRRGFGREVLREIKSAYSEVYVLGNYREQAESALASGRYHTAEALKFLQFFREGRRPFMRARREAERDDSGE